MTRRLVLVEEAPSEPVVALTIGGAARAVDIGEKSFRRHVLPHLRVVRIGEMTLVKLSELERWLEESAGPSIVEEHRAS